MKRGTIFAMLAVAVVCLAVGYYWGARSSTISQKSKEEALLSRAKLFHLAIQARSLDGTGSSSPPSYPADFATNTIPLTKAAFVSTLVDEHYLSQKDVDYIKPEDFNIYNVAETDPPDAVLFTTTNFGNGIPGYCPSLGDTRILVVLRDGTCFLSSFGDDKWKWLSSGNLHARLK